MPRTAGSVAATRAATIATTRDAAIGKMPPALLQQFRALDAATQSIRETNLRFYHRVGAVCLEIRSAPEKYNATDGTAALDLLSEALLLAPRVLTTARTFAENYPAGQLDELINLKNTESDFQLNWGHVNFLLTVHEEEKREEFAKQAVESQWSPGELHEKIKESRGGPLRGGRPHKQPTSAMAGIRQMQKATKTWLAKFKSVWHGDNCVFAGLCADDDTSISDMLAILGYLRDELDELADSATEARNLAEETYKHLQNRE